MNVQQPQAPQQGQIRLEQQPLEILYKLFRERVNLAEQIQRDLDGTKRDIVLINAVIQKKEEAAQIEKQAVAKLEKETKEPKPEEPKPEEPKPEEPKLKEKTVKKKGK